MKLQLRTLALFSVWTLITGGAAFAHGNKVHINGTVEKISADSVTVKKLDGKSVEVKLVASTAYVARVNNEDKPAKAADLSVGYRVVIHATPKDNALEADEIRFSAAGATKLAAPASAKPKP